MSRHPRNKPRPSEPPTIRPPFDLDSFARESDSKIRIETDPPSRRPTVPPLMQALVLADERAGEVPSLAMGREDLEWFELSPMARSLLRHVNGRDTVDVIASRLAMTIEEVMTELDRLAREGVVTLR
jgi:hypothetical protein